MDDRLLRGYLMRRPGSALVLSWVDRVGRAIWPRRRRARPSEPRRVLIVKIDHLGDVLNATVLLPHLRRSLPDARIDMLVSSGASELVREHPDVDAVHTFDHVLLSRRGSALRRIARHAGGTLSWVLGRRAAAYDVVLVPRANFPNGIPLVRLSGAAFVVGWSTGGFGWMLDASAPWRAGRHEVDLHLDLLRELGIATPGTAVVPVRHLTGDEAVEPRRVLVAPGSGSAQKRWDTVRWQEVVREVVRAGLQVTIVGSDECRDHAAAIRRGAGCEPAEDVVGETDIAELARLVGTAALLVGVDSFPCHLAAACGTPVVTVYTGTDDPRRWRPRGSAGVVVVDADAVGADVAAACLSLVGRA